MALARTYLDYNSSAPLLESAYDAMLDAMQIAKSVGVNASSVHSEGRSGRKIVEQARSQLGAAVNAASNQIVFTSGASEAATHALSPIIKAAGRQIVCSKLYVSATEHPCVLAGGRFTKENIEILPVLESGLLDLNALAAALEKHDKTQGAAMVSVMLANNETGILQPIDQISKLVLENDAFLCVDAVQAFGKIALDVSKLNAHFIILSSHKIGGPQGAGALIFGDASISPQTLIAGGGQENFQRAGTENIAAIAGFGAASAEIAQKISKKHVVATIRDSIEEGIRTIYQESDHKDGNKIGEPVFFSSLDDNIDSDHRLPNTTCFAIPGIKAETALISLDLAGFSVSSGSACSSGKVKKSHVLDAMGVSDEVANCALRISTGYETSAKDAENFLGEMKNIVNRMG